MIPDLINRFATLYTNKIYSLPILVLMPHSRCNCRCVMCDIWKANQNQQEISMESLQVHLDAMLDLKVKWVVLSGGEALMHSNLWKLCQLFKDHGIKITLLSTGILLKANAQDIVRYTDEVIVSLDGSKTIHNEIRNIPRAYEKLADGVGSLKEINPEFQITGRSVLQKANYHDLPKIVQSSHELGLDQISFLAADISTTAFNRPQQWETEKVENVALSWQETQDFAGVVEQTIKDYRADFRSRYIAESPKKMRNLVQYYRALHGKDDFPKVRCNAPWVSTVIESDGQVLPCFFHRPMGNIFDNSLDQILNSPESINFRKQLNVDKDPICRKCVCSLHMAISSTI